MPPKNEVSTTQKATTHYGINFEAMETYWRSKMENCNISDADKDILIEFKRKHLERDIAYWKAEDEEKEKRQAEKEAKDIAIAQNREREESTPVSSSGPNVVEQYVAFMKSRGF